MRYLSCLVVILFASCSLFENVPEPVIAGQRTAYEGVGKAKHNYLALLEECAYKLKSASEYTHNYGWDQEWQKLQQQYPMKEINDWDSEEETQEKREFNALQRAKIESLLAVHTEKRDNKIAWDHEQIDKWVEKWRKRADGTYGSTQRLMEAVYNWMSTSPLTVDNIASVIESSKKIWDKLEEDN